MCVDEQLQTRHVHPCKPLPRGRKTIDLDRVYTNKFLNRTKCLPVQPANKGPCKFWFMLTRVKRNANMNVLNAQEIKITSYSGTSFFVAPKYY